MRHFLLWVFPTMDYLFAFVAAIFATFFGALFASEFNLVVGIIMWLAFFAFAGWYPVKYILFQPDEATLWRYDDLTDD